MRKAAVVENLRTAAGALVLGVLLWYITRNEMTVSAEVEAAVVVTAPGNVEVKAENGRALRVRAALSGPVLLLDRVRESIERRELAARVALSAEQADAGGVLSLAVTESAFDPLLDRWMRLSLIDREVRVVVRPMASRMLQVRLVTDLDPSRIQPPVIVPPQVRVRGPKALLDRLTFVNTERLELSRFVEEGRREVPMSVGIAREMEGVPIECDERVWVNLLIGEESIERTFPDVRVDVLTPPAFPYDVRLDPQQQKATVVVRGPRSVLTDPLVAGRLLLFVRIGNPRDFKPSPTPYLVDRQYLLPEGVTLVSISGASKVNVDILERVAPTPPTPP